MIRSRRRIPPDQGDDGGDFSTETATKSPLEAVPFGGLELKSASSRTTSTNRRKTNGRTKTTLTATSDGAWILQKVYTWESYISIYMAVVVVISIACWVWMLSLRFRHRGFMLPWSMFGGTREFQRDIGRLATQQSKLWEGGTSFTIFYQIFVPDTDDKGRQNALRIINEQMQQIQTAIVEQQQKSQQFRPFQLYYYTIGRELPNRLKEDHFRSDYCIDKNSMLLSCTHGGHAKTGSEDFTLQALFEFCRTVQRNMETRHHEHRVVYLHSKGSYHHSRVNENWRYHLTSAALHPSCLSSIDNTSTRCHVCGLQFFTEWAPFFPGNMWTAQCSYVAKLIPPRSFEGALESAVKELLYLQWKGQLESHLYSDRLDRYGLDRYHSEHWIASHPMVQPCDMSSTDKLKPWLTARSPSNDTRLSWSMAPRHRGGPADQLAPDTVDLIWKRHDSRREVFYLTGLLIKHLTLYQQVPPPDSWVWTWFRDGPFWLRVVEQHHGTMYHPDLVADTLLSLPEEATQNETTRRRHISLRWRNESLSRVGQVSIGEDTPGALYTKREESAVFVHINADDPSGVRRQIDQVEAFTNEWRKRPDNRNPKFVYFQFSGHSSSEKPGLENHALCSTPKNEGSIQCQQLPPLEQGQVGETMQELHNYCLLHPLSTVTYLDMSFGNLSANDEEGDTREIERVLSELGRHDCTSATWQVAQKQHSCNVCGPGLTWTAAGIRFRHNLWTSPCSFVRTLLNPVVYGRRMSIVTKDILTMTTKRRLVMEIFKDNTTYLPDEVSMLQFHWPMSHPLAVPCSSSSFSQTTLPRSLMDLVSKTASAPAYSIDIVDDLNENVNKSLQIRECSFLACHVLRWGLLYQEQPPPLSWVWFWFPYGSNWLAATTSIKSDLSFGPERIVEQVASPFSDSTV